jgi:co-chaperonin GroES (HSP10)
MVKRQANHNPSRRWQDIRLCDRQYLVQGPVFAETESETTGGIWIPVSKEMKTINVAKVLAVGPGCTRAAVGEYVTFSSITGENFNHLKPQPVYRDYFDEEGLYTLHEDQVRAVIPEAQAVPGVLLEECDGKDSCCEKGRPLSAVDSKSG